MPLFFARNQVFAETGDRNSGLGMTVLFGAVEGDYLVKGNARNNSPAYTEFGFSYRISPLFSLNARGGIVLNYLQDNNNPKYYLGTLSGNFYFFRTKYAEIFLSPRFIYHYIQVGSEVGLIPVSLLLMGLASGAQFKLLDSIDLTLEAGITAKYRIYQFDGRSQEYGLQTNFGFFNAGVIFYL